MKRELVRAQIELSAQSQADLFFECSFLEKRGKLGVEDGSKK